MFSIFAVSYGYEVSDIEESICIMEVHQYNSLKKLLIISIRV